MIVQGGPTGILTGADGNPAAVPGAGAAGASGVAPGIYGGGYPPAGPVAPAALSQMYPMGGGVGSIDNPAGGRPVIGDPRSVAFGATGPTGIRTIPGPTPLPPTPAGPVLPGPRAPGWAGATNWGGFQFQGPRWFQNMQTFGAPNPQQTQQILNNFGQLQHMQHQQMRAFNAAQVAPGVPRMLAAQAGVIGSSGGGGGNFAVSPHLGGGGGGAGAGGRSAGGGGGQYGLGFGGQYGYGNGLDANSMFINPAWNYDAQGFPYAQALVPNAGGNAYAGGPAQFQGFVGGADSPGGFGIGNGFGGGTLMGAKIN